jgi:hypothetical protein
MVLESTLLCLSSRLVGRMWRRNRFVLAGWWGPFPGASIVLPGSSASTSYGPGLRLRALHVDLSHVRAVGEHLSGKESPDRAAKRRCGQAAPAWFGSPVGDRAYVGAGMALVRNR